MSRLFVTIVLAAGIGMTPGESEAIPYFARKYNLSCATCHVSPPKLNAFGEDFRRARYRESDMRASRTVPLAVWMSGRSETLAPSDVDAIKSYLNRVEIISGGEAGASWLTYFVEWRPLSFEARPDGTLRDRSGRFEDLFVNADLGEAWEVTVGQFRQVDQVDVSLRAGLSEPIALSASVPGEGGSTARLRGLRGFSPSGRSPSVRAAYNNVFDSEWMLTASAAVPFPGEFSTPLTREAREQASNEFELYPKGVLLESFVSRGTASYGGHLFYGRNGRYLINTVATAAFGPTHWATVAGVEDPGDRMRYRWSLQGEYFPHYFAGFGARVENRTGDGLPPAVLPYLNIHFPGTRYTVRLTLEQRFQEGRNMTAIEIGTIF